MSRLLAAAAFATIALVPTAGHAAWDGLGGQCDGAVDVNCRYVRCGEDDLDCGLVPPCLLWVATACVL